MCGIAGLLGGKDLDLRLVIGLMVRSIRYRGPDDAGNWVDPEVGVALGHARLSILDLSSEGHQPMRSAGGRYLLSYNGEIYNFTELRAELERLGAAFRGHSDTEVMLAAIETWGVENAVGRFVGMFAFALWDLERRELHLGRDRVGIKPLYYGWVGSLFAFGSELKAFEQVPGFSGDINRDALVSFMRLSYVPTPFSIYRSIYKLPPGCLLTVPAGRTSSQRGFSPDPDETAADWRPIRYWSARCVAEAGVMRPFEGTDEEALDQFDELLTNAVGLRMISDVPLGAFLSGGVDSSLVSALMQKQSRKPIRTFTIGFDDPRYNEATHAKRVAQALGTDHTELYISSEQAMAVIPRLPHLYDEPFGDPSQIPTFLVSELARRSVTVSLSGDGGDELFAGYNRYFWWRRIWNRFQWMPESLRHVVARLMTALPAEGWDRTVQIAMAMMPWKGWPHTPGDKIHKLADMLRFDSPAGMYLNMVSQWKRPAELVIGGREPLTLLSDGRRRAELPDFTGQMMYLDLMTYLPDDILTKVDRASMGNGLEARVPLLDHRVIEFAWRLPLSMKIKREGEGKWLLRHVLYRYVPRVLIDRPKTGFGIPIDQWLRGPLRAWAEDLLSEARIRREGFLHPGPIRERWAEHLSGRRNWQYQLWNVLMFQAWLSAHERSSAAAVSHH